MCVFKSDLDQIGNLIEIDVRLAANVLPHLAVGWFFSKKIGTEFIVTIGWWQKQKWTGFSGP
jgi:outer membrane protein W